MKLVMCIPQLIKGGAERVICNLANYFVNKNEVYIISLRNYEVEYVLDSRINILYVDEKNDTNKIKKFFYRIKRFKKIIGDINPDLILSFLPEACFLSLIFKEKFKYKTVISVRNDPKQEFKKLYKKILMKLLYNKSDGIVFQTNDAKKYFSKRVQEKSVIIPNSINPNFIVPKFDGVREKKIVAVGRLTKQKNHILLINAFKRFSEKFSDYKLYIYGDGVLKNELKLYIDKLKMEDKVILAGVVDDIKKEIYNSSLYVLSSDFEGMPNSLMEAMALGIPCISTDCPCGGPKMLIENNKNGILIKIDDEDELYAQMVYLIKNKDFSEMLGKNSNEIMKSFDPEIINKKWENYLMEIFIG